MAATASIALRSVQRIWKAHWLQQQHRIRTFKRSNEPRSPPSSSTSSAGTSIISLRRFVAP